MENDTATRGDERYHQTLVQMMEGQAYRELGAAQLFGHGLSFVHELRYLKIFVWHIREEMEHYADVARMYADYTGRSVEPIVEERLAKKPIPQAESFYELAMAQFLFDRGGYFQLREYENCSHEPYRRVIRKIVAEERGHQALGERLVLELTQTGRFEAEKQTIFERWLRQGLLSFGRPGSEGARYAISVGLRRRDPAAVIAEFLVDIAETARLCGLSFPKLSSLGIEASASAAGVW